MHEKSYGKGTVSMQNWVNVFCVYSFHWSKLYSNNPININHVHKDSKYFLYVIVTLITNIIGGDALFYGGINQTDLVKRAPVLKHLHGRIIMGAFEIFFLKGSL